MIGHTFDLFNSDGVKLKSIRYFKKYNKALKALCAGIIASNKELANLNYPSTHFTQSVIYRGRTGDGHLGDWNKLTNLPTLSDKIDTVVFSLTPENSVSFK